MGGLSGSARLKAGRAFIAMKELFPIVFEDDDLLVINKPADLVCHPTKGDVYSSLISRVRLYLGDNGSPQLINRLDRETSGLVLVAKNPATAWELRRLWESRQVAKSYLAIVHGEAAAGPFVIDAPLGRDETSAVVIKNRVHPGGLPSRTVCERLITFARPEGRFSLVRVQPETGRKHQIRIHLAHAGHPIVGDKLYGGDETLYLDFVQGRLTPEQQARLLLPCQALHAEALRFRRAGNEVRFHAEPERWFRDFVPKEARARANG